MDPPLVITAVEPEFLHLRRDASGAAQLTIDIAHVTFQGVASSFDGHPVVINFMASDVEFLREALR